MAKIGNGILGGIKGSISNVSGYRRKSADIIQSKNDKARLNDSALQVNQQTRFLQVVNFMKFLRNEFGYFPFESPVKTLNSFNYGEKINFSSFDKFGICDIDNLKFAVGKLYSSFLTSCVYYTGYNSFATGFNPACSGEFCDWEDIAYQYAVNLTKGTYGKIPGDIYRNAGRAGGISPVVYDVGDEMYVFMVFLAHPDYSYTSNSIFMKAVIS